MIERLSHGANTWRAQSSMVCLYLGAIVTANLIVARFGPSVTIINAVLFIGLDLSSRDKLHEAWHRNGLIWKMGILIAVGSLFSWILNRGAGQIALASFVSFACAALVDTIIYQLLHGKHYFIKVNGSNIFSAAVDSILFPTLAFGILLPLIILGQFMAKIFGGAIWAYVLHKDI